MSRWIRVFVILVVALTGACRSSLADSLPVTPKAVDEENAKAQIARAESLLRSPGSQPTFSHGESSTCSSSSVDRYGIESEDCTYQLPALRQRYITSKRYSIGTDTVFLRVELKRLEAQTPLYYYTFVSQGGAVSFREDGQPFGSLPRRARRVLRRLLEHQAGRRST